MSRIHGSRETDFYWTGRFQIISWILSDTSAPSDLKPRGYLCPAPHPAWVLCLCSAFPPRLWLREVNVSVLGKSCAPVLRYPSDPRLLGPPLALQGPGRNSQSSQVPHRTQCCFSEMALLMNKRGGGRQEARTRGKKD